MSGTAVEEAWFYGAPGWTRQAEVDDVVAPFLDRGRGAGSDFARFAGLGSREAAALLERLPEANLRDRQNRGPECAAALRAAVDHPGDVLLHGYVVGPPRWDERVSVDGIFAAGAAVPPLPDGSVSLRSVWRDVREGLGLGARTGYPDDFRRLMAEDAQGRIGWWMWWD